MLVCAVAFGGSFEGALFAVVVLVFVTIPLSFGYLLAQIGLKENATNAIGNIVAMVFSFLGGAWVDSNLLGSDVVALAHFTSVYWYVDALSQVAELCTAPSQAVLMSVLGDIGIILLFAVAIFVIALVIGRMRIQSVTAGGNQAAAQSRI